jgi:hypothetical protein
MRNTAECKQCSPLEVDNKNREMRLPRVALPAQLSGIPKNPH